MVPQRTLHRYCAERTEYRGRRGGTVPVADGEPGVECQIDFARMGMVFDSETGRRRVVHALIFTAVYSRHMFVWLTFSQTLEAVIAGCEAAWRFFGGVFKVLIPDNMSTDCGPVRIRSTRGSPSAGWSTPRPAGSSPTRPGWPTRRTSRGSSGWCSTCATTSSPERTSPTWPTPRPAPRRGAPRRPGSASTAPRARARRWCSPRPEAALLLPAPAEPYAVPIYARGQGAPRLPRPSRQGAVFDTRTLIGGRRFRSAPTVSW